MERRINQRFPVDVNQEKALALAYELERSGEGAADDLLVDIVETPELGNNRFGFQSRQVYLVLTDAEADAAFVEYNDALIEDAILPEIMERYRRYFDKKAYTRDVRLSCGRGTSLALYDGEEHEAEVNGVTYFIYRTT